MLFSLQFCFLAILVQLWQQGSIPRWLLSSSSLNDPKPNAFFWKVCNLIGKWWKMAYWTSLLLLVDLVYHMFIFSSWWFSFVCYCLCCLPFCCCLPFGALLSSLDSLAVVWPCCCLAIGKFARLLPVISVWPCCLHIFTCLGSLVVFGQIACILFYLDNFACIFIFLFVNQEE